MDLIIISYVKSQLDRVDIVWHDNIPDSLTTTTRHKRGKGKQRLVIPTIAIPRDRKGFLRVDGNKTASASYQSKSQASTLQIKQSSLHVAKKPSLH